MIDSDNRITQPAPTLYQCKMRQLWLNERRLALWIVATIAVAAFYGWACWIS